MTQAILSRLGEAEGAFPWEAMLVLFLLLIAYGLIEYIFGRGLRRLWSSLTRPDDN
ncbi:hypothetical protein [Sphingomonas sp. LM7]|uniref:hypothetical protein n=1 Tax=Sphingomonas sp. LM7 TaxID=1938607 RepID=UPI0015C57E74|nr:hypothetical protein [Sphingomonas sp. LM7]